jgi:hypothetical protein
MPQLQEDPKTSFSAFRPGADASADFGLAAWAVRKEARVGEPCSLTPQFIGGGGRFTSSPCGTLTNDGDFWKCNKVTAT